MAHTRVTPRKRRPRKPPPNPDFRHRSSPPAPDIEEVHQRLAHLLSPSLLAPRLLERRSPKDSQRMIRMRARVLTLSVIVAIILSMVFRRLNALAEVQRLLDRDGLLWVQPLQVSAQAITKRLDTFPAAIMDGLFAEVIGRLRQEPPPPLPPAWAQLEHRFTSILALDGSTLEALRKQTKDLRTVEPTVLGGKVLVMVDALRLRPVWQRWTEEAEANEKRFADELLAAVPVGGLAIYDLGFFSFPWFDAFTEQEKYFVTRLREKTAYQVVRVLGEGPRYREQIIQLGQYRSNPCRHGVRLVEVQWGPTWHRYLTNVLDPQRLSARDVCGLYQRRWRIEDAFLVTKRLLDLAYLWSGSRNAVRLQVTATLLLYLVLVELCQQVADLLSQPLERISMEMVFRSCYFYSTAGRRGETRPLAVFLAGEAKLFGLVKRERQRDKERAAHHTLIWGDP